MISFQHGVVALDEASQVVTDIMYKKEQAVVEQAVLQSGLVALVCS